MSSIPSAIIAAAQAQGVDPTLALEVAQVESGMNQNAVSSQGAIGVFQLMPATAADLGVNASDVNQNIQGGVTYLRQLLSMFGDPTAVLAAYNWGLGNVQNAQSAYGSNWFSYIPSSVQNYVNTILNNVSTQYSVVSAATASAAGVSPGGSTSLLTLPSALAPPLPSLPVSGGFSWETAALLGGAVLGIALVAEEL